MGTWYIDFCVDLPGNGARNGSLSGVKSLLARTSPATAPEILLATYFSTALVFPEEEGMIQQSSVSISLSF